MVARIYRTEGVLAFYSGVVPAMLRQVSYGGLCFASYPLIRDFFTAAVARPDATHPPLWARIAAGAISGSAASVLANPTDVVKVRLQADGRLRALGQPARYKGTFDAFRTILGAEGLNAFWKGSLPNMQRAAVVNGAGIAAYDHSKVPRRPYTKGPRVVDLPSRHDPVICRHRLRGCSATRRRRSDRDSSPRSSEDSPPRCAASRRTSQQMTRGRGSTTTMRSHSRPPRTAIVTPSQVVGCPFDVLKTRMMNQHAAAPIYRSLGHCFGSIVMIEGPLALWKGLLPVYMRQAPFNMLNFMIMEQLTKAFLGTTM